MRVEVMPAEDVSAQTTATIQASTDRAQLQIDATLWMLRAVRFRSEHPTAQKNMPGCDEGKWGRERER